MTVPYIEKQLHGSLCGITKDNEIMVGNSLLTSSMRNVVQLKEDFLGDVIPDQFSAAQGTDGQGAIAVVVAGAEGGAVRLQSGDTVTVAESLSSLTHGLNWKSTNGLLVFEAGVTPVTSVADVCYFVGLTDTLATTTLEEPITLSGTTYTTNATDAVGFVYDTNATTDVFYAKGVKADTDSAAVALDLPVAGTKIHFRIEIDSAGVALFYVNGTLRGRIADAVTPTVALTPIVCVMARTTTVKPIDVDYINCFMIRA
jgi:hypothetical protein